MKKDIPKRKCHSSLLWKAFQSFSNLNNLLISLLNNEISEPVFKVIPFHQLVMKCFVSWYCFIYFQAYNDFKSTLRKDVVQYSFKKSLFDIVVSKYERATEYMKCKITYRQGRVVKPCDKIIIHPLNTFWSNLKILESFVISHKGTGRGVMWYLFFGYATFFIFKNVCFGM